MKNKYEPVQEKQYIKYKQLTSSVPHKKGANRILKKKKLHAQARVSSWLP